VVLRNVTDTREAVASFKRYFGKGTLPCQYCSQATVPRLIVQSEVCSDVCISRCASSAVSMEESVKL